MHAKKSLGQHFLTSASALKAIRDVGDVHADDIVLEIGPGKGALTDHLLPLVGKIIAVEKDKKLVTFLREKYQPYIQSGLLDIVEKDILDFDPNLLSFYKIPYKVIANIPYYITGAIIEKFLSAEQQPEMMVLLIQKEVAERIVARNGKESILSLSVKAYGTPHIVKVVPRGAFNPVPHVDSAILAINNISREKFSTVNEDDFFTLVKKGFSSKRKFLKSNIGVGEPVFIQCEIPPKARAEDLTLTQWLCLARAIRY